MGGKYSSTTPRGGDIADDRLKNFVLSLADTDYTLSEQARLVVLAALGAPTIWPRYSATTPPHPNWSSR